MPTVVEALFEDLRAILLKPDQAAGIFPSAKVAAGRTVAAGSHGRGTGRPFMAEVFAMSRFRPAGFRNGRTAWRRASRPVSGRPARRRSTAFRDGWNRIAAAGPHGTPLRLGTRSRHGRRAPRGAPLHGGRQRQIRGSVPSHGARVLEVRIHLPPAVSLVRTCPT